MTTALDTISVVASSILSSALVTAIVQIVFKERMDARLEHLRNELATEKSAREEDAHRISEQLKTQFSWLYVERAKAMSDIYACIFEVDESVSSCIPPLSGWGLAADRGYEAADLEVYRKRVHLALEAGERFERSLRKSRLLFGKDLAEKLERLVQAYESMTFELDEIPQGVNPAMLADSSAIMQGQQKAREILNQIESEFRTLYGSFTNSVA